MEMERLEVKSLEMAMKTLRMIRIAYNLVKALQLEAIREEDVVLDDLSFKATLDAIAEFSTRFTDLLCHPRLLAAKHLQGFGAKPHLCPALFRGRPTEAAIFQPLRRDPQAGPIEVEQLDVVAAQVDEDEELIDPEATFAEMLAGRSVEPVEALAHVARLQAT